MPQKKKRQTFSVKKDLIEKSYEVALSATQIFNSPLIKFKTESFIVLMMIAWTYILHAYYHQKGISYRYYEMRGKKKYNTGKYWDLTRCLSCEKCPLSIPVKKNIEFLLAIRHQIEHCKVDKIDEHISAKLFACCYNFSSFLKQMSNSKLNLERDFGLAIQFSRFDDYQIDVMKKQSDFTKTEIGQFIVNFEKDLPEEISASQEYSYGVYLLPKVVNKEGQADRVVEIVKGDKAKINSLSQKVGSIIIQERNTLDKYHFSSQQLIDKLKGEFPHVKKSEIQQLLTSLKGNKDYHAYNFSSPKWKQAFEKTGKPRYATHVYNDLAYKKIKSLLEKK